MSANRDIDNTNVFDGKLHHTPAMIARQSHNVNRARRIMFVGGEFEGGNLCSTDQFTVNRVVLPALEYLKYPRSSAMKSLAKADGEIPAATPTISVKNTLPQHGGQDFLEHDEEAEVLVLGSIPVHSPSYGRVSNIDGSDFASERLNTSFARSQVTHSMKDWRQKMNEAEPKIVFLMGGPECHQIGDLISDNYVGVRAQNCNMLISKDVLDDLEMSVYYLKHKSPLAGLAHAVRNNPGKDRFVMSTRPNGPDEAPSIHFFRDEQATTPDYDRVVGF